MPIGRSTSIAQTFYGVSYPGIAVPMQIPSVGRITHTSSEKSVTR